MASGRVSADVTQPADTNTGAVRRASLDGSNIQDLISGDLALATGGVVVDDSHLYWTSYAGSPTAGTIRRANLDGSNPQAIVTGQAAPFGIAVDDSHLYWTNSGDGTIWRASLDGTNAQSIVQGEGQNSLFAVAVDASHLYWTNRSQAWSSGPTSMAVISGTLPSGTPTRRG
jgi:sugar lactone lactonase YvrE